LNWYRFQSSFRKRLSVSKNNSKTIKPGKKEPVEVADRREKQGPTQQRTAPFDVGKITSIVYHAY
jgi:hypothetical protein